MLNATTIAPLFFLLKFFEFFLHVNRFRSYQDFDDEQVLNVLIAICSDRNEDHVLISICGESIGTIWARKNSFNPIIYQSLHKAAQREIDARITRIEKT